MPSAVMTKLVSAPDPQFGEDVKPDGSTAQMGEVSPNEPPLDPTTEAVLEDKDRTPQPPIVPDDEE